MVQNFLFERFYTGTTGVGPTIYGARWEAQTFTIGNSGPKASHYITSIGWRGYRAGSPGIATFSIQNVDATAKPIPPDLCFLQFNATTVLTTGSANYIFEWVNFAQLLAGKQYALVIRAPAGTSANYLEWRGRMPDTYTGGTEWHSTDSGGTWVQDATTDMYFYDFGIPIGDPLLLKRMPYLAIAPGMQRYPRSRAY